MTTPHYVFFWLDEIERGFDVEDYPNFVEGVSAALASSVTSGFAYLYMRRIG